MALIRCPECKHKISDTAKFCPKCGYLLSNTSITHVGNCHDHFAKRKTAYEKAKDFFSNVYESLPVQMALHLLMSLGLIAIVIAVIALFFTLLDWGAKYNSQLSTFIGITVLFVVVNLSGYYASYKGRSRKPWFFWVGLCLSGFGYLYYLSVIFS